MYRKFLLSFALFGPNRRPMSVMHNLLIGANAIIISGEHRFHSIISVFLSIFTTLSSHRRKPVSWGVQLRERLQLESTNRQNYAHSRAVGFPLDQRVPTLLHLGYHPPITLGKTQQAHTPHVIHSPRHLALSLHPRAIWNLVWGSPRFQLFQSGQLRRERIERFIPRQRVYNGDNDGVVELYVVDDDIYYITE